MKTVLAIGGSDSGGCSGIQADLKTISALGFHGATALTSVTAQNTLGVHTTEPLSRQTLSNQLRSIYQDLNPGALKTGLLVNADTVSLIAETITSHLPPTIPVVVDPVIHSSTGQLLLPPAGQEALLETLLPLTTLVTPNADEATALTGVPVHTPTDAVKAGRALLKRGCKGVLIKGGHFTEEPATDLLVLPNQVHRFVAPPLLAPNARGTGCSLASAIAALLMSGLQLREAIEAAKAFIYDSIRAGYSIGAGPGPIDVLHSRRPYAPHPPRCQPGRFHALTDQHLQNKHTHLEIAQMALQGGADVIQYREVNPVSTQVRVETARAIKALCDDAGATFIVNDRVDVAHAVGASGVHLGKHDLCPTVARGILGPNAIIGRTANSLEEALEVSGMPVDYIGAGPVFGTTSKEGAPPALGLELFSRIAAEAGKPVIAIGGIQPPNVRSLFDAGAYGIAVLSGLWRGEDPLTSIREYHHVLKGSVTKRELS